MGTEKAGAITLIATGKGLKAAASQFVNWPSHKLAELVEGTYMLELVFILVFLAATAWIAVRAFQHPKGTYLRSLIGLLLGVVAAGAVWWLASPVISNEAGLGAFVLFCIVVALCAFVAIIACIAASVRHVLNAFANRRRRS